MNWGFGGKRREEKGLKSYLNPQTHPKYIYYECTNNTCFFPDSFIEDKSHRRSESKTKIQESKAL